MYHITTCQTPKRHRGALSLVLLALLGGACVTARAEKDRENRMRTVPLRVAPWVADHMVLPADRPVSLRGTAAPGSAVTVAFAGQKQHAAADADGEWLVTLDPMVSTTHGRELTIQASDATPGLAFRDVVVGETWLCAGQSNMAFTVNRSAESGAAKKTIGDVEVRFFTGSSWRKVTPATVGNISAVGAWLAMEMARRQGAPVGLVVASRGGTDIEAWTPRSAFPDTAHGRRIAPLVNDAEVRQAAREDDANALRPYGQHRLGKWGLGRAVPASLFEKHMRPLAGLPVRGIVWYQGESNAGSVERASEYRVWLKRLVVSWREHFAAPDMPFVVIQLPEYDPGTEGGRAGWAELQKVQAAVAQELDGVELVVTKGLGDPKDIHPTRKMEVGRRAAEAALGKAGVTDAAAPFALAPFASAVPFSPFAAGDRVAFLGDSITASGNYVHMLRLFYATRFPDRPVRLYNCGIGGARAETSWQRIEADCLDRKPTIVVTMLGMNDAPGAATKTYLSTYQKHMTRIMDRVVRDPTRRLALLVSSPYDQTAGLDAAIANGKNDRIRVFGAWLAEQSRARKVPLVDFNTPMLRINAERQRDEPAFSVIGRDRIHPGAEGHAVMMYHFVRSQGVTGSVARVEIDAETAAVKAERAAVRDVVAGADQVSFVYAPEALPYPAEAIPFATPAEEWARFTEDLNREWLVVEGLKAGRWVLSMNGESVGEFTAGDLAYGIDLARLTSSPGYRQAHEVLAVADDIKTAELNLRAIARCRWIVLESRGIDLDDTERAVAAVRAYVSRLPTHTYWQSRAEIFYRLRAPENREAERVRMETLMNQLYKINTPKPQHVELRRR